MIVTSILQPAIVKGKALRHGVLHVKLAVVGSGENIADNGGQAGGV